jgi:selenide,water dikinase
VLRLDDELATAFTVDFFTPMVDDPYTFGCIAAANALSDLYAMGATPRLALNLLACSRDLGTEALGAILRGGADTVRAAGAVVAGGHSIEDDEPKYGLAVMGTVHPDRIIRNRGALPGDVLYYTKCLGIGIMMAALKAGLETEDGLGAVIGQMKALNAPAARAMRDAGAHAATDVTGFGLVGHLHEMLAASGVAARIDCTKLPLFERAFAYSEAMCRPGKSFDIIAWAEPFLAWEGFDASAREAWLGIVCDPQTSGGLLVALAPGQAPCFEESFERQSGRLPVRIGEVAAGTAGAIVLSEGS